MRCVGRRSWEEEEEEEEEDTHILQMLQPGSEVLQEAAREWDM